MDDIEDSFFANLSQSTIETAIEVCVGDFQCLEFFVLFQEGRSKIKVAAAGRGNLTTTTTTTTRTTNVLRENDENSGIDAPKERKAPPKTHTLDDDDAKSVVAMELCDFASMPMVDLVWCRFWNF